ncbi:hypothetical protein BHE74_00027272 [Ensete ventricosum]|nr:hypothetical protein BHE74_00027272 [Ensete ventricosum]
MRSPSPNKVREALAGWRRAEPRMHFMPKDRPSNHRPRCIRAAASSLLTHYSNSLSAGRYTLLAAKLLTHAKGCCYTASAASGLSARRYTLLAAKLLTHAKGCCYTASAASGLSARRYTLLLVGRH